MDYAGLSQQQTPSEQEIKGKLEFGNLYHKTYGQMIILIRSRSFCFNAIIQKVGMCLQTIHRPTKTRRSIRNSINTQLKYSKYAYR